VRTAVFITPESLFSRSPANRGRRANDAHPGTPVFQLAAKAVNALRRLKQAGFMIIGVAGGELFRGFASPRSCREFLTATELDDLIIARDDSRVERCNRALIQAAGKWLLDLDRSFIIGRGEEISEAGLTGCTALRIGMAKERPVRHDLKARTLEAAVDRILSLEARPQAPVPG
jgi:hypothetical protein